jgi:uncharacterized membrane protein HdeD (DUF308 family)
MASSLGMQFPWVLIVRGILAALFGVVAFVMPFTTLAALVLVFGAFALVDGVFALAAATRAHGLGLSPWPYVIEGVFGVAAGLATFIVPAMTALVLLLLIAAWAIVAGVFRLIAAVRLRRVIRHDWLLVLSGLVAIAFGVLTVLRPAAAALGIVLVLGAYSIVFGALFIGLGLRLRREAALVPA